jgi:hypothetical protein
MWTLFFGGKEFTPDFVIDGENVQDYLQNHYLNSQKEVASMLLISFSLFLLHTPFFSSFSVSFTFFSYFSTFPFLFGITERVKHMSHVIGFDTLNEPSRGWIAAEMEDRKTEGEWPMPGYAWSAFDGLRASRYDDEERGREERERERRERRGRDCRPFLCKLCQTKLFF